MSKGFWKLILLKFNLISKDLNMAELKLKMGSCNGANWILFDVMYVLLSSLLLLMVL